MIKEKLLSRSIPEPNTGCLLWTGAWNSNGYGSISVNGKVRGAHRVSYEQFIGDPGKLLVLHRCDVPCCIEPSHLFLGTDLDNARDRDAKGRCRSGIRNAEKKLCKHGHSLNDHGFINTVGVRQCRICVRARNRTAYNKTKEV